MERPLLPSIVRWCVGRVWSAAWLATTLVLALFPSCAPFQPPPTPTPAPPQPTVIRFWDFQQALRDVRRAHEQALQRFRLLHPEIDVRVEVFPYVEYRDRLEPALREGNPPDVAALDQIWMAEFAAAGHLEPLDAYLAGEAQPGLFFPNAWESVVYRGRVWGIPLSYDVWFQLYYRPDLFRQAGLDPNRPPTTWEELYEYGQRLTRPPDQYGIGLLGGRGEDTVVSVNAFIFSNGGQVVDLQQRRATINQPAAVEAIEFYRRLAEIAPPGTATRRELDAARLFVEGRVAMVLLGSWQQDTFRALSPLSEMAPIATPTPAAPGSNQTPRRDFAWAVALPPAPAGKTFHGTLGGWNGVLFRASPHKAQAWSYLRFLGRSDVQLTVASLIPARWEAGQEFVRRERRAPEVILSTLNTGKSRPLLPTYSQISAIQQEMLQEIWAGAPVQEAADRAAAAIDAVLER